MAFGLTSDQVEALTVDAILGREPSVEGDAALAFYRRVLHDVRSMRREGVAPDVPFEFPDPVDGGFN